jgi:hypothetical protein
MTRELASQTRNAFDLVHKLYFEVSYLIKEVEGLLQQEEEQFLIIRPSGYMVTTRTSMGLDPANVELWFPKNLTVFFCAQSMTELRRGQTFTPFNDSLKIMLLHIDLFGKHLDAPRILSGCIRNIQSKKPATHTKFEHLVWEFAHRPRRIFDTIPAIPFEDSYCSFSGEFIEQDLYSLSNSEELVAKLIDPMLKMCRA